MKSRPLRVCVVIPGHWSKVMGGAQYQAQLLVNVMIKKGGYEVYYLARSHAREYQANGYSLCHIDTMLGVRSGYHFLDAPSLYRNLKVIAPDAIYQRVGSAYTGVSAFYSKRSGCQMLWHVASEMDLTPLGDSGAPFRVGARIDKFVLEYGIRNTKRIVVQTQDQAELLQRRYRRSADAVVPNFHPMPTETIRKVEPVRVVWLANIKRVKRPEVFIQLARDLGPQVKASFVMIGSLQGGLGWRNQILEDINSTENLEYLGYMEQENVNKYLAESHILVNTSLTEGFSNTFIQAWMRQMPVVSLGVNPDNVFSRQPIGECAYSYDALVQKVKGLIENRARLQQMGVAAAEYAARVHSEHNSDVLLKLLTP